MQTRKLRQTLRKATPEDVAAGEAWYREARSTAADIAGETGCSLETAAGVIAALSPRCQWASNVKNARRVLQAAAAGADTSPAVNTKANRRTSWDIAMGADAADRLRGPKTNAFYHNIMGDEDAVTVDVWAMRAAGLSGKTSPTRRQYADIAAAYRRVAKDFGMSPAMAQATAWIVVRGSAA
jgi:hypothetical protein